MVGRVSRTKHIHGYFSFANLAFYLKKQPRFTIYCKYPYSKTNMHDLVIFMQNNKPMPKTVFSNTFVYEMPPSTIQHEQCI